MMDYNHINLMDTAFNNDFSDGLLTKWHVVNLHHLSSVIGFCYCIHPYGNFASFCYYAILFHHRITPRKLDTMSVRLAEDMRKTDLHKNKSYLCVFVCMYCIVILILCRNLVENFIISDDNRSTVVERGIRTSLTFRKLRCYPCTCGKQ